MKASMQNTRNKVWIDQGRVFEARPIADVISDGHTAPENRRIKWVVFRVFTRVGPDLDYDAVGYAETLKDAMAGRFVV